jgi:hypothetical protein
VFDATLQVQMIESSPWEQTEFHHRKINVLLNVPSYEQKKKYTVEQKDMQQNK